jgi:pimeloyl-ACP methyl ester carboxylesterase
MPELAGVRHTYVDVNGFRAHVAEAGDPEAPPVVLQHGWPQHWWCWRKVIPPLAERYRVICPDLRGHGWSEAPRTGYDKPQFAADLIGVMDALGIDRARLVGHDWGAMAGFLACIRHPERFERYLALGIAPPFRSDDPKQLLGLWRLYYQIPLTAPLIAPRLLSNPGFLAFLIRKGMAKRDAMSATDVDSYARVLASRPHVSLAIYRTFVTREIAQIAAGRWTAPLHVPTVVLVGEHDIVGDVERTRAAGAKWADDLSADELPGVGHFTPEEAPDAVVERALALFA